MHIDRAVQNFETEYGSTPSKTRARRFRFAEPRMETSMIVAMMLTKFPNGRRAPQAPAPSPSCPIAEFRGSGSDHADAHEESSPFSTVTGRMSSRWGGARSARGRRIPPRHAQPGIHEYTAQTLEGG